MPPGKPDEILWCYHSLYHCVRRDYNPTSGPESIIIGSIGESVLRRALAEIYGWFTEGFDTPDLQEARALLEAL